MKPEMVVRRLAHSLGYRYRLHQKHLPGKPDLVFPGKKKVIFVHGCFWHQHADPQCKLSHTPKSNREYWAPKLEGNVKRDRAHEVLLRGMGWECLIIWECQVRTGIGLAESIQHFLDARSRSERAEGPGI